MDSKKGNIFMLTTDNKFTCSEDDNIFGENMRDDKGYAEDMFDKSMCGSTRIHREISCQTYVRCVQAGQCQEVYVVTATIKCLATILWYISNEAQKSKKIYVLTSSKSQKQKCTFIRIPC